MINSSEIKVPKPIVKRLMETLENNRINNEFESLRSQILELKAPAFLISKRLDNERDKMIQQMESFKKEIIEIAKSEESVINEIKAHLISVYNKLYTALNTVQEFTFTNGRLSSQNISYYFYDNIFHVQIYETISKQNIMTVKIQLKDGIFDVTEYQFYKEQLKTIKKAFDINHQMFTDLLNTFNFEDYIKMNQIINFTFNRNDHKKQSELLKIWGKHYKIEDYVVNSPYQLRNDMLEFKDICELEHDLKIQVIPQEEVDSTKFVIREKVKKKK